MCAATRGGRDKTKNGCLYWCCAELTAEICTRTPTFFLPLMKKKQGKEHEGGELQNNGYTLDFWTSMQEFF